MSAVWKKIITLDTGELLEIRLDRREGRVDVRSCVAHGSFVHDGDVVSFDVPLHLSATGGFDFRVDLIPQP